jgi:protein O-mannosyl-transferase
VESVAWVAERKDVLSAFFWILTMSTYALYVERPRLNRYLLVVLCFALALMSKPMTVTLPFVLFLMDYWPLSRLRFKKSVNADQARVPMFRLILEKAPLFFLSAASSVLTLLAQWKGGAVASLGKLPMDLRIGNALLSYVKYIEKMIMPSRLAVLYPHPIFLPLWEVAGSTLLLGMITVLVILARRRYPYYIVGWLWYLGTLFPVIGLVQVGIQGMADRYTYISMIGLFIMVVYGISDILKGWRYGRLVLVASGTLLLLMLMSSTMLQVKLWRNSVTLFSHTLHVTVNNYIIQNNLGVTLARQGKDQEAVTHYLNALKINPGYADAHYNLGVLLARQRKEQEAIAHLAEALRIKPNMAKAHNDLGAILYKQGKIQEAIDHFSEAVHIDAKYAEAQYNLGTALVHQGRNEEALACFRAALRINPKDARTHNNLGLILARQGKIHEAIVHYIQALQTYPDYADAHYNLAALLARQGKDQEAVIHYTEVLRITPNDAQIHYELGIMLTRQGKNEEAITHLTRAVGIVPNYDEAHFALGMLYSGMGKQNLAFRHYRILLTMNQTLATKLYQNILMYKK